MYRHLLDYLSPTACLKYVDTLLHLMVFSGELPCYLAPSSGLKFAFEVMPRPPSLPHGGRGLAYGAAAGFLSPPADLKYADTTCMQTDRLPVPVCWPEVRGHDSLQLLDYLSPSVGRRLRTLASHGVHWRVAGLPAAVLWPALRVRGHAAAP